MQIKRIIKETYGSGIQLTPTSSSFIFSILAGGSLLLFFLVDPTKIDNGLPVLINQIAIYYISSFLLSSGFLFLALFFYCKPIPVKDRFKYVKIISTFCH